MINIKNKKITSVVIAFFIMTAVFLLWITGIVPSFIARTSAEKYVDSRYKDRGFEFLEVRWDSNWDRYFVSFKDKSGNVYSFKMSEHIPSSIMYDPLDPPG